MGTPLGSNKATGNDDLMHIWMGIGSQIDGLGHMGVNHQYYNGHMASDFVTPSGLTKLSIDRLPPVATRGVLLDIAKLMKTDILPAGTAFNKAEIDAAAVRMVMSEEGRLPDDLTRDSRSRPEAVIPLLHIAPGARVVDIFGSGGYYSELLAGVVGDNGEVWLHNNDGFEAWGINGLRDRFDKRDPGNINRHTRSGINLDLGEETMDAAIIVMALHDIYVIPKRYNGEEYVPVGSPANAAYFLEQIYTALKTWVAFCGSGACG